MQHLEERSKNIYLPIIRLSSKAHVSLVGTAQELQIILNRGILRRGYIKTASKSYLESRIPTPQFMPKANPGPIPHFESSVV